MEKTRIKAKKTKSKKVKIDVSLDDATLKSLTKIAKLADVSLNTVFCVILAAYVCDVREIKGEGFDKDSPEIWTKDKKGALKKKKISYDDTSFGFGEK